MIDISDFKQVFRFDTTFSYQSNTYSEIHGLRMRFSGSLFFDRLLAALRLDANHDLYPPKTNKDLQKLHQSIVSAEIAEHHKQSLLFYILKDCRTHTELEPADEFARKCYLPDKYRICIEGLWAMDRAQFREALEYLTHPSLIPTFSEEILHALVKNSHEAQNRELPLAYYHTVQPSISHPEILEDFFKYLAKISITDAFYFARRRPEEENRSMLEMLIHGALSVDTGSPQVERGVELVDLPFTEQEEHWFEAYLLEGKGRNLYAARDTVMVRRIAIGKLQEALEDGKNLSGRQAHDLSWDLVKDGIERGIGPQKNVGVFKLQ